MKYLLVQLFLLLCSVTILYYFSTIPGFTPTDQLGEADWSKIGFVIFFIFLFLQSFIGLIVYLVQKFLAYGRKEFPNSRLSLKWGIGISLCVIAVLFMHLNHIVTLGWGLVILAGCVLIIIIV